VRDRQEAALCGSLRSAPVGLPLTARCASSMGVVMVAAGRDRGNRPPCPRCQGRSLLAVAGSLPGALSAGRVPARRRNAVRRSPTITLGVPGFRLTKHSEIEAPLPSLNRGRRSRDILSGRRLAGTSRSIVPHGPTRPGRSRPIRAELSAATSSRSPLLRARCPASPDTRGFGGGPRPPPAGFHARAVGGRLSRWGFGRERSVRMRCAASARSGVRGLFVQKTGVSGDCQRHVASHV
jgi:hypothetical protein